MFIVRVTSIKLFNEILMLKVMECLEDGTAWYNPHLYTTNNIHISILVIQAGFTERVGHIT